MVSDLRNYDADEAIDYEAGRTSNLSARAEAGEDAAVLLPCPWCQEPGHSFGAKGFVTCNNEDCPVCPSVSETTEAEAIAAWNTRAPDAKAETVAEIVAMLREWFPGESANDPRYQWATDRIAEIEERFGQ